MIRADTSAVIAMVANQETLGDRTVNDLVGEAVREASLSSLCVGRTPREVSVAADQNTAGPFPTFAGLINLRPEASYGINASLPEVNGGRLIEHRNLPFGAIGPAASNSAGLQSVNYTSLGGA